MWARKCTSSEEEGGLSTSEAVLTSRTPARSADPLRQRKRFDAGLLLGIFLAFGATIIGISATGVGLEYFLQPAGAIIVLGGALGVIFITTPGHSLLDSVRRVRELFSDAAVDRDALAEEIVRYARTARKDGVLAMESLAHNASHSFLRDAMLLGLDVNNRVELKTLLETELRLRERQGEMDAKTLEVAGGFAPTIGILGTVVGLIDVMRHFSNLTSVGYGIGTAFVSTIYGLALANLVLLPIANRIRARVAEAFEVQELIMEGVLATLDREHPAMIRQRMNSFLRVATSRPGMVLGPLDRLRLNSRVGGTPHGS